MVKTKIFVNDECKSVEKNIFISNPDELKMISPFACFVVGCTGSGKSVTVLQWFKNSKKVFKTKFTIFFLFIWFYISNYF